jgi:hypothetical protein
LFWFILVSVKGFPILGLLRTFKPDFDVWIIATILFVDWLSLVKAKFLLDVMSKINTIFWIVIFVVADMLLTLLLLAFIFIVSGYMMFFRLKMWTWFLPRDETSSFVYTLLIYSLSNIRNSFFGAIYTVVAYFGEPGLRSLLFSSGGESQLFINDVAPPSTMLTSTWTVLLFIAILLFKLLARLEFLRRFTLWWFKDIDAHPLRAIAKVAATLIVVGAFALKAVQRGWMLV